MRAVDSVKKKKKRQYSRVMKNQNNRYICYYPQSLKK
jgi:hypothetical protein